MELLQKDGENKQMQTLLKHIATLPTQWQQQQAWLRNPVC